MFEADRLVIAGLTAALLGLIYYRACRRTAQVEPFDLSAQHAPASAAAKLSDLAAQADAACYELDVYGKGGALHAFEAEVAALLSKPAACFFATGTAAQQAVCYAHTHATVSAVNVAASPAASTILCLSQASHAGSTTALAAGASVGAGVGAAPVATICG